MLPPTGKPDKSGFYLIVTPSMRQEVIVDVKANEVKFIHLENIHCHLSEMLMDDQIQWNFIGKVGEA